MGKGGPGSQHQAGVTRHGMTASDPSHARFSIRRHHSGNMVKPVQRPKMTTKAQQVSENPPASLAGSGGVGLRSHFCTPRTVMNSKISMLIPARIMTDILIQNVVFTKYSPKAGRRRPPRRPSR
jgi:hypothetical protein